MHKHSGSIWLLREFVLFWVFALSLIVLHFMTSTKFWRLSTSWRLYQRWILCHMWRL